MNVTAPDNTGTKVRLGTRASARPKVVAIYVGLDRARCKWLVSSPDSFITWFPPIAFYAHDIAVEVALGRCHHERKMREMLNLPLLVE